jgi:hypothetical protein
MKLRIGQTLISPVDTTTVIVVRAPAADLDLTCVGVPMAAKGATAPTDAAADSAQLGGTQLGKRYADEGIGVELLCTKPGQGTLAIGGEALPLRDAKPLPTSD